MRQILLNVRFWVSSDADLRRFRSWFDDVKSKTVGVPGSGGVLLGWWIPHSDSDLRDRDLRVIGDRAPVGAFVYVRQGERLNPEADGELLEIAQRRQYIVAQDALAMVIHRTPGSSPSLLFWTTGEGTL